MVSDSSHDIAPPKPLARASQSLTTMASGISESSEGPKPSPSSLIVLIYKGRRVITVRPASYDLAVASSRRCFPSIPSSSSLSFLTDELDICNGQMTEVFHDAWNSVIEFVKSLTILEGLADEEKMEIEDDETEGSDEMEDMEKVEKVAIGVSASTLQNGPDLQALHKDTWTIRVTEDRQDIIVNKSEARTSSLLSALLAEKLATDPDQYDLIQNGQHFSPHSDTGAVIEYRRKTLLSSPTLYFFSPRVVRAVVNVSLPPNWSFGGIKPVVAVGRNVATGESVQWKVVVHPSGFLTEQHSGDKVYPMRWRARPAEENSLISDDNSVILDISRWFFPNDSAVQNYFGKVFALLGVPDEILQTFTEHLHYEIRRSKVKYALVTVVCNSEIGSLDIDPVPDVLTKILFLYRSIQASELDKWPKAFTRVEDEDVSFTMDTVTPNRPQACDDSLFKVYEIGALEV
ncbi:hypothetical protein CVT26_010941 [Gymnopilus dilepis]|uniref:Uncharacterized protein n=1 Tax=Gymnopilus dilepis TaxID=231916 RepID=A0A409VJ15_9AGAR|nr:hypothetical protein CVT26_010941 [Gymnopilus dilepis]